MTHPFKILVVNKYVHNEGEYIGRGSPLGNPYPITATASRETVINQYREYLNREIQSGNRVIIDELTRLFEIAKVRELKLKCFCSPKPCHGDVIKDVLMKAYEGLL